MRFASADRSPATGADFSSPRNARAQNNSRRAGYSLIESAIVLMVLSLLVVSFIGAYRIYLKSQEQLTTVNNESVVLTQIQNYLVQKGHYPCPAPLDAARGSAAYGSETQCDPVAATQDITKGAYPAVNTSGTCAGGVCFEESVNLIGGVFLKVRRGAIPFRDLGLREDKTMDGYGNRMQYVVTEALAGNPALFDRTKGAIRVYDAQGRPIQVDNAGAEVPLHYILFSSGPDRVGAYSYYGQQIKPCTGPVVSLDMENCNTSPVNLKAYYRVADRSEQYDTTIPANAAKHFDDYVKFYSTVDTPLWRIADKDGYHIRDLVDAELVTGGKVAVHTNSVSASTKTAVEVSGDVRDNNSVVNNKICDTGGANCFTPAELQKTNSVPYNCLLGSVTGIHNDAVDCAAAPSVTCPSGSIMTGITSSGALTCAAVVGCTTLTTGLCSPQTWTIPAGVQAQVLTSPVSGVSYQETWKCGTSGTWSRIGTSGVCSCTAQDTTYTQDCNSYKGYGNWTGVVNWRYQHFCPANTDSYTKLSDNCACANITYNSAASCGVGYTGSITYQQNWTCSSTTAGSLGPLTETGRTCACTSQPDDVTTSACPALYSGSITSKRVWTCTSGTTGSWGPTIPLTNTCTCTGGTQYQTIGCVSPLVGSRDQARTYDCATSTWTAWSTYNDNCGAVVYTWHAKSGVTGSGSTPQTYSVGGSCSPAGASAGCSEPAGGGTYNYYSLCQCE